MITPGSVEGAQARLVLIDQTVVIAVADAEKHARLSARELVRRDGGIFQRFPSNLQRDALLRIHALRFARGDSEEVRIEHRGALFDEPAPARAHFAGNFRIWIVESGHVPPFGGDIGDRVHSVVKQPPEGFRIARAGQAATNADDRDGLHSAYPTTP